MNVNKPSISMRSEPDDKSSLETECLFGESVKILDENLGWYYCKLITDNYLGWVEKKNLSNPISPTHRVISKRTFFFKNNDVKSGCINYLPLGSYVLVQDIDKEWAKVLMNENSDYGFAYIPSKHLIKIGDKVSDWVGIAEKLIGTPYVWGGRNSIGLDCSALLQLSYQTYGEDIPRNSADQILLEKEIINSHETLKRGFTIFWKGHVGIMSDSCNCVHANAFHMEVSREPLVKILKRTKKNNQIIKIMNFN